MSKAGRQIIQSLKEATQGDYVRVHINGVTWVRADAVIERQKLAEISHILESEWQEDVPKRGGGTTQITVNNHAYYTLEAAIDAIKRGLKRDVPVDDITIKSLEDVQARISQAMRIASEYRTRPGLDTKDKADENSQEVRPDGEGSD